MAGCSRRPWRHRLADAQLQVRFRAERARSEGLEGARIPGLFDSADLGFESGSAVSRLSAERDLAHNGTQIQYGYRKRRELAVAGVGFGPIAGWHLIRSRLLPPYRARSPVWRFDVPPAVQSNVCTAPVQSSIVFRAWTTGIANRASTGRSGFGNASLVDSDSVGLTPLFLFV
jgi:hypothetical protein